MRLRTGVLREMTAVSSPVVSVAAFGFCLPVNRSVVSHPVRFAHDIQFIGIRLRQGSLRERGHVDLLSGKGSVTRTHNACRPSVSALQEMGGGRPSDGPSRNPAGSGGGVRLRIIDGASHG
jgi:hypothetical protein